MRLELHSHYYPRRCQEYCEVSMKGETPTWQYAPKSFWDPAASVGNAAPYEFCPQYLHPKFRFTKARNFLFANIHRDLESEANEYWFPNERQLLALSERVLSNPNTRNTKQIYIKAAMKVMRMNLDRPIGVTFLAFSCTYKSHAGSEIAGVTHQNTTQAVLEKIIIHIHIWFFAGCWLRMTCSSLSQG